MTTTDALIATVTTGNRIVRPMPAADDHLPISILNRRGRGLRTMTVCSCEWQPRNPPERSSTACNAHMAHRRAKGLPRLDNYAGEVFGEGPWMGLTWNDWYAVHGGNDLDPYTGKIRRFN